MLIRLLYLVTIFLIFSLLIVDSRKSRLKVYNVDRSGSSLRVLSPWWYVNRMVGLSNIPRIDANSGVMFRKSSWSARRQRQTFFDSDVVFMDSDKRVLAVHSCAANSGTKISQMGAKYVLILARGASGSHGLDAFACG